MEVEYFKQELTLGSIRICHYGCGIYYLLVVTGNEKGKIWVDDRASDYGIYPAKSIFTERGRLTFSEWYDEWLVKSIDGISAPAQDGKISNEEKNMEDVDGRELEKPNRSIKNWFLNIFKTRN